MRGSHVALPTSLPAIALAACAFAGAALGCRSPAASDAVGADGDSTLEPVRARVGGTPGADLTLSSDAGGLRAVMKASGAFEEREWVLPARPRVDDWAPVAEELAHREPDARRLGLIVHGAITDAHIFPLSAAMKKAGRLIVFCAPDNRNCR